MSSEFCFTLFSLLSSWNFLGSTIFRAWRVLQTLLLEFFWRMNPCKEWGTTFPHYPNHTFPYIRRCTSDKNFKGTQTFLFSRNLMEFFMNSQHPINGSDYLFQKFTHARHGHIFMFLIYYVFRVFFRSSASFLSREF